MLLYKSTLQVSYLGFSAIFMCVSVGFLCLKRAAQSVSGPGSWGASFLLGGIGFFFWSGIVPLKTWQFFLIGEILHFHAFLLLGWGVYLFVGGKPSKKSSLVLLGFLVIWICGIRLFTANPGLGTMYLRILRSIVFLSSGITIFTKGPKGKNTGKNLTGTGFILWGAYSVSYGFIAIDSLRDLLFGFLVGLQILAAFGLVVMIVDRIRKQAEEGEKRIGQLTNLLPICSYCSNIRDANDTWKPIEEYIEERTASQFSHGICPNCLEKHFPQYVDRVQKQNDSPMRKP